MWLTNELDALAISEMAIHVPMCSHKEPKDVALICVGASVVDEMTAYKKSKYIYIENDSRQAGINFVKDEDENSFDIVVSQAPIDEDFAKFSAHTARILKDDGLAVFELNKQPVDISTVKTSMLEIGKNFKIVMPYRFSLPSANGGLKTFILASKEYHPTADIILQRADLIDGLKYYNSDIHHASFVMPNYIRSALRGIAKN